MDQLLGALGPELEAHEAEEGSDSDDDAVSGTDQGAVAIFLSSTMTYRGPSHFKTLDTSDALCKSRLFAT